jgi:cytochrome c peroxidase
MTGAARRVGAFAIAVALTATGTRIRPPLIPAHRSSVVEVPSTPLRVTFEAGVDSLSSALADLGSSLASAPTESARAAFRRARRAYKHQEALLWYYTPSTASILNGPLEEEDDETPPRPLGSVAAFQRVEQRLFGKQTLTDSDRALARDDVKMMRDAVVHFRSLTTTIGVSEMQLLDASRTELARVSTLSLAGVDSDESGDAVVESAESLDGMRALAAVAASSKVTSVSPARWMELDASLRDAIAQLRTNTNADSADRLPFLAMSAMGVGRAILAARKDVAPMNMTLRSVWRPTAATLFDKDALDAFAFSPDFAIPATPDVIALGEKLFNDVRLSGPQTRSCASCHVPRLAFADGMARQNGIAENGQLVARNTPTLLDAALQPSFFSDARAATLEAQIAAVLSSPAEMASSLDIATRRLGADSFYRSAFARLAKPQAVTSTAVRAVLAAYVRSLVVLDARFDEAVRGNLSVLSAGERRGFTLFMGKAKCGTCHFAPTFSGTMPPTFTTSEPEIIGVPTHVDTANATLDTDLGRSAFDGIVEHEHAFKVPSLRNVERTAPYMHNGAYSTLEQVVDFYDRGGGSAIGATVPGQTLSSRPLHLSAGEQADLVAFLKSLTDRTSFAR